MALSRTASMASSVGTGGAEGSSGGVSRPRIGVLKTEGEGGDEETVQRSSLESGVFGVLFTLSQEKNQRHIQYRWILLKIALDAWQLFSTVLQPGMGWTINGNSTAWKVVSVLDFGWLADMGYGLYVGMLYSVVGLLAANLALCVWVAYSFKVQKFDYVWPIKVVRGFSYVFFQVFDITSLNFLQLGISCNYGGPMQPHLHMSLMPKYSCSSMPHLANAVVSGLVLLLFVAVALLLNMSEVEVDPKSKSPQALGHSGAECMAFGIKAVMTVTSVFLGWPKVAAVVYAALALLLAYQYLRWAPHLVMWVNHLKSGVAVSIAYVTLLQLVLVFQGTSPVPRSLARAITLAMGVGAGPAFLAGATASWLRVRLFTKAVLRAFKNTNTEEVLPQDVYHFADPRDVEIAARSARVWTDLYTLDKEAVRRAEEVVKAGTLLFPDNAFVSVLYANFLLDNLGFSQTGRRQMEAARKLSPGLMCRFMMFVRQQQATQKAASAGVGDGGTMDLLGYVEYQRKQRMVLRHHKEALQAMAQFWKSLGSSSVSFTSLSKSLENIDTSVSLAESAYRVALEHYSNSPRLVRLYGRFLETIKQNPWGAAEYYAAADRLEETKDDDGQGPLLPDGTPLSRMDDVEKGVLVVNAFGEIQMGNTFFHSMFGYRKGELDGKNVTLIMPQHAAKRHPALLRRYIDSAEKAAPYFRHPVMGLHKERVVFTIRLSISRASGLGEDSVFIGMLEQLPSEPGTARLWVTQDGVIVCCDPGFVTHFGYRPDDIIGTQLDNLLRAEGGTGTVDALGGASNTDVWTAYHMKETNQAIVQRMITEATNDCNAAIATKSGGSFTSATQAASSSCHVLHKYDEAKECNIGMRVDLTKYSIFEVTIKLKSQEPQLLMVMERSGVVKHMSGHLAKVLGVGPEQGAAGGAGGRRATGGAGNGARGAGGGKVHRAVQSPDLFAEEQVMLELTSEAPQRTLEEFLPSPWKHLHHKYIKHMRDHSKEPGAALANAWGCRAACASHLALTPGAKAELILGLSPKGPTLKLCGPRGQPVFVHVQVYSRQQGSEQLQVVRMAQSTQAQAVAERRLRLRVSEAGTVLGLQSSGASEEADGGAGGAFLFGFPPEQLVGRRVWEFVRLPSSDDSASDLLLRPYGATAGGARPAQKSARSRAALLPDDAEALAWDAGPSAERSERVEAADQDGGAAAAVVAGNLHSYGRKDGVDDGETASGVAHEGKRDADEDMEKELMLLAEMDMDTAATVTAAAAEGARGGEGARGREMSPPLPASVIAARELLTSRQGSGSRTTPRGEGPSRLASVTIARRHAQQQQLGKASKAVSGQGSGGSRSPRGEAFILEDSWPQQEQEQENEEELEDSSEAAMQVEVNLPPVTAVSDGAPGHIQLEVYVDLWVSDALTGVLELDSSGRVSRLLEEDLRPAGLLWGQPREALLGRPLDQLLLLGPGQTAVGLLTESGIAKKSALKMGAKTGAKEHIKVGPVHQLLGRHRDGRTLALAVQMVGRPGPGQPVTAIVRLDPSGGPSPAPLPVSPPPKEVPAAGAATPSHVCGLHSKPSFAPSPERVVHNQGSFASRVSAAIGRSAAGNSAAMAAGQSRAGSPREPLQQRPPSGTTTSRPLHARQPQQRPDQDPAQIPGTVDGEVPRSSEPGVLAVQPQVSKRSIHLAGPATPDADDHVKAPAAVPQMGSGDQLDTPRAQHLTADVSDASAAASAAVAAVAAVSTPRRGMAALVGLGKGDMPMSKAGGGSGKATAASPLATAVATAMAAKQQPASDAREDSDVEGSSSASSPSEASSSTTSAGEGPTQGQEQEQLDAVSVRSGAEPQPPAGLAGGHKLDRINKWVASDGAFYQNDAVDGLDKDANKFGGREDDESISPGHVVGGGVEAHRAFSLHTQNSAIHHRYDDPEDRVKAFHAPDVEHGKGTASPKAGFHTLAAAGAGKGGLGDHRRAHQDDHDDHADDARSEGGDSAVSGTSGVSDMNATADFKRGKRYRKLIRLLETPQAQRVVTQFKFYTLLTILLAGAVHVVCFALIIVSMQKQSTALAALDKGGIAQRHLQRALVAVRALDQIYKGRVVDNVYTEADAPAFADDILTYTTTYRELNQKVLEWGDPDTKAMFYSHTVEVAETSLDINGAYTVNVTLWDLVQRLYVSANTLYQHHATWQQQGLNLSATPAGAFMLLNGQAAVEGAGPLLEELLVHAEDTTKDVNTLQLAFLVVEGAVVTFFAAALLVVLLQRTSNFRYKLYETFLSIPIGLTRALASQTMHLLDDDESEDGDEEEDERTGAGAGSAGGQMAEGEGVEGHESLHEPHAEPERSANVRRGGDKRRALFASSNEGSNHGTPKSEGPGGVGGLRKAGFASSGKGDGSGGGGNGGKAGRVGRPLASWGGGKAGGGGGGISGVFSADVLHASPAGSGHFGWFSTAWAKLTHAGRVHPRPGHAAPKRALKRNSHIISAVMANVAAWSALTIVFYAVVYVVLLQASRLVAEQAVCNHNAERTYRAVFHAQELAAEESVDVLPSRMGAVQAAATALRDAYYSLRLGDEAYLTLGPGTERFHGLSRTGLAASSPALFRLFYGKGTCLRLEEHMPCPPPDWRFYQVTLVGVDGMMTQFLTELGALVATAAGGTGGMAAPGLNDTHWDYIYNVGTKDLNDGNLRILQEHYQRAASMYRVAVVLHVILFLLLMCVFGCFLLLIFLPLLRRMAKEKRRIAEMMSQLPPELDVEKMVAAALVGGGAGAAPATGRKVGRASNGRPSPLGAKHEQGHEEGHDAGGTDGEAASGGGGGAYGKWKALLDRTQAVAAAASRDARATVDRGAASVASVRRNNRVV